MLLAIDVGNTNIVVGVFDGYRLLTNWRLATDSKRSADEYGVILGQMFRYEGLDPSDIDDVIISTVVPSVQFALEHMSYKYFRTKPIVVATGIKTGLKIKYDGAGTLSYTIEWEVGATPIALTGEVQTPYGQEITIPVNDIIAKLGSATLTITFTDDDGKHTSTTDPMEEDKTETPADLTEDKGDSKATA